MFATISLIGMLTGDMLKGIKHAKRRGNLAYLDGFSVFGRGHGYLRNDLTTPSINVEMLHMRIQQGTLIHN